MRKHTYSQQDITFKIADLLDQYLDIKYSKTDLQLNAYDIESTLSSTIDSLGLKIVIDDMAMFECFIEKNDTDELPF